MRQKSQDESIDGVAPSHARALIGGVGYRWTGDASFGLIVTDELARCTLPPQTEVADLGYGAIYVAQDLGTEAGPKYDRLVLIAGVEREREPGQLYAYRWQKRAIDPEELQARIREAGAGVIDLDHLLLIADYFGTLPETTEIIELEPVDTLGEHLSSSAEQRSGEVIQMVCRALEEQKPLTAQGESDVGGEVPKNRPTGTSDAGSIFSPWFRWRG